VKGSSSTLGGWLDGLQKNKKTAQETNARTTPHFHTGGSQNCAPPISLYSQAATGISDFFGVRTDYGNFGCASESFSLARLPLRNAHQPSGNRNGVKRRINGRR